MNSTPRAKLFIMMVLELFIWGAWLPPLSSYVDSGLHFDASQQFWIFSAFPIAAIVGMFFSNQFADRNFAAERYLAASHLIGGAAILGLAFVKDFPTFFALMLLHCLLYVPTLSITNSIAFASMKDPQKEFGIVRMGGTIGWILAAWPFIFILIDWDKVSAAHPQGFKDWLGTALGSPLEGDRMTQGSRWAFLVSGIASFALAAFSLTLPHTPPKKAVSSEDKLAWVEAAKLLRLPFVLVLWLVTLVDATVHNLYFLWTYPFLKSIGIAGNWIQPIMSIGQVAEILTMAVLGLTLKRLGWKATMLFGILGHVIRFTVFAMFPEYPGLIIAVNILHGICYAFFFATVYIFVDEFFPKDARASAQGLFNFMILGVGAMLASYLAPKLSASLAGDYKKMFLVPAAGALAATLGLALFFRPPAKGTPAATPGATPH